MLGDSVFALQHICDKHTRATAAQLCKTVMHRSDWHMVASRVDSRTTKTIGNNFCVHTIGVSVRILFYDVIYVSCVVKLADRTK